LKLHKSATFVEAAVSAAKKRSKELATRRAHTSRASPLQLFNALACFRKLALFRRRCFCRGLIQQLREGMRLPILPAAFVKSIAGDQRHRDRRLRVNHLFGPLIDFAPRIRFLERGTTE